MQAELWPSQPLPWQVALWQGLRQAIEDETFPHAWLITGPPGLGKLHLLRALAKLLLCHEPLASGACDSCKACALVDAGSHSDLLAVEPQDDSRIIKVEQVRGLISFAQKTAGLGRRKVIILSPAEVMNVSSANALLKSLEEPAPETHLLLLSHRISALPATLRSRCQCVHMPVPESSCALDWLSLQTGEASLSGKLLDAANGAPLAALNVFLEDSLDAHQDLLRTLRALAEGSVSAVEFSGLVESMELDYILGTAVIFMQQVIRETCQPGELKVRATFKVLDDLQQFRRALAAGANPNRQLLLEDTAVRMRGISGG